MPPVAGRKTPHSAEPPFFRRVWALVRRIPRGKVCTYGQLALFLGEARGARTVGWAMRAAPQGLPWHRVINAQGHISEAGRDPADLDLQRALLASEGIRFDRRGRVDLARFGWTGPGAHRNRHHQPPGQD